MAAPKFRRELFGTLAPLDITIPGGSNVVEQLGRLAALVSGLILVFATAAAAADAPAPGPDVVVVTADRMIDVITGKVVEHPQITVTDGRIAAIADVFDAMTSDRVYRSALPVMSAIGMMREERGKHFDHELLDSFFELLPELGAIRAQYAE